MDFYTSIADYYNYIFPPNAAQVSFTTQHVSNFGSASVLDVGCGTGNLSRGLAQSCKVVTGIDLDEKMVNIAIKSTPSANVDFRVLNMLKLDSEFEKKSFDTVVSYGNTLVHLGGLSEIAQFLQQVKHVLKHKGKLLLQVINYDRILDQNIKGLPTIENDIIRFERHYPLDKKGLIRFKTILTVKETHKIITNSVPLFPLRSSELKALLEQNGFEQINTFGNFKGEDFNPESSIPFIIEARVTS